MNKYQESLDFIVKNSCSQKTTCMECNINNICNSLAKEHIDRLQELVDKATPKKIKIYGNDIFCPECEECVSSTYELLDIIDELKYCPYCGQAINLKEWDGNEKDY